MNEAIEELGANNMCEDAFELWRLMFCRLFPRAATVFTNLWPPCLLALNLCPLVLALCRGNVVASIEQALDA